MEIMTDFCTRYMQIQHQLLYDMAMLLVLHTVE